MSVCFVMRNADPIPAKFSAKFRKSEYTQSGEGKGVVVASAHFTEDLGFFPDVEQARTYELIEQLVRSRLMDGAVRKEGLERGLAMRIGWVCVGRRFGVGSKRESGGLRQAARSELSEW